MGVHSLLMLFVATRSPARRAYLRKKGWKFKAIAANAREVSYPHSPARTVVENAVRKASSAPGSLVAAFDTVIFFKGKIYGKPKNVLQAKNTLKKLSGKWHEVYTCTALRLGETVLSTVSKTKVKIKKLGALELEEFASAGLGKAGAYGIQEKSSPVEKIQGRFDVVVGLDESALKKLIKLAG